MTLFDMIKGAPWYVHVFVFGGLTGGWWYFCDGLRELFKRRSPAPAPREEP